MKKIFLTLQLIAICSIGLFAQTESSSCKKKLEEAQKLYEKGKLEQVAKLIEPCLDNKKDYTDDEKISARKLLVNTYLYYNEKDKAIDNMTEFLTLTPEYKIDSTLDSPEFIALFNSFRRNPTKHIGIKFGTNNQHILVNQVYSTDVNSQNKTYKSDFGIQVGLSVEFYLNEKLFFTPEAYFYTKKFSILQDNILGWANTEIKENQSWLEVPVLMKYFLGDSKNEKLPYITFGPGASFLLTAEEVATRGGENDIDETSIDVSSMRNKFNLFGSIGAGLKLKHIGGLGSLELDFRYNFSLNGVVKDNMRGSNFNLLYNYLYLDDDFTQNTMSFSVGYYLPTFNPIIKEKNRVITEEFLNESNKKDKKKSKKEKKKSKSKEEKPSDKTTSESETTTPSSTD